MSCRNHPGVDIGLVPCSKCADMFCSNCVVYLQGQPVCGSCKQGTIRDARAGVVTQGLDLASVGRRFGAYFVDGFLLNIVTRILGFVIAAAMGQAAAAATGDESLGVLGIQLVVILGVVVAYDTLMVVSRGQTLGKMALKVKVVSADGSDVSFGQAFIRSLIKLVPIIPYLPAFFTKEKTGLHDMAAGTRVIRWG